VGWPATASLFKAVTSIGIYDDRNAGPACRNLLGNYGFVGVHRAAGATRVEAEERPAGRWTMVVIDRIETPELDSKD